MYKAIKIDIEKQLVYEVEINDYKDIQKEIDCRCFTIAVYINEAEDCIFVDDEGLFGEIKGGFEVIGRHQPFAGNGVLVGSTSMGDSKEPSITIDEVRKIITFLTPSELKAKFLGGDLDG